MVQSNNRPRSADDGSSADSLLPLANNENAYGPSPRVRTALRALPFEAVARYADPRSPRLVAALARAFELSEAQLAVGSGSSELITLLCKLHGTKGPVVLAEPAFPWYRHVCSLLRARVRGVRLSGAANADVDALSAAAVGASMLFLTNPNNPTGTYLPEDALRALLARVPEEVVVVIDEAYAEYADAEDYLSALRLTALHSNLVVLRTFSKAYALAGARVGWSVAPESLTKELWMARSPYSLSCVAEALACAALEDQGYVQECARRNARERVRTAHALRELGIQVRTTQANFYLADLGLPSPLAHGLLSSHGVETRMLSNSDRWIRLSVGTEEQNDRLIERVTRIRTDELLQVAQ